MKSPRFGVGLAVALILAQGGWGRLAAREFEPLVKGQGVSQFELIGIGPKTVSIQDGEVHVSGKPNGYFATRESYRNYVLRFEWRYERPEGLKSEASFQGNSGLLLHIAPPHKVWPVCIESQLMNADAGNLFGVSGAKFRGSKDAQAQKKAVKPVGDWNFQEVTCKDGSIVCTINGVEVSRGDGASPDHGPIAWQSEGAPISFRNLMIKPLD
ncbi:MAG: DUF1080 domain-containing protein [Planctomycetia bacterium]|nr:DUF1080 domain-containing protein [Planctomycetia bacterium]